MFKITKLTMQIHNYKCQEIFSIQYSRIYTCTTHFIKDCSQTTHLSNTNNSEIICSRTSVTTCNKIQLSEHKYQCNDFTIHLFNTNTCVQTIIHYICLITILVHITGHKNTKQKQIYLLLNLYIYLFQIQALWCLAEIRSKGLFIIRKPLQERRLGLLAQTKYQNYQNHSFKGNIPKLAQLI